jgi:hypothetical protein
MFWKICENAANRAPARLPESDGGDTVPVWQRQGKTSQIRALTPYGCGFSISQQGKRPGILLIGRPQSSPNRSHFVQDETSYGLANVASPPADG